MVRAPFFDENGVKKGAWSAEEDEKLRAYVEKHGFCNWRELPRLAGLLRCGKSCRLRWINYLRPDVKRGNYSKEEENLILKLHQKHGNKWSLMATKLPGRTDNEIKNYWHTNLKKLSNTRVAKKQHGEAISKSKPTQKRESDIKPELALADEVPTHQIFESSPVSPFSSEISNVWSNHESAASPSTIDMAAEDISSTMPFQFQESVGDFWGEPFVADTSKAEGEFDPMFFDLGGFNPANSYVFDDDEDLIWQVMKELPENYQPRVYY